MDQIRQLQSNEGDILYLKSQQPGGKPIEVKFEALSKRVSEMRLYTREAVVHPLTWGPSLLPGTEAVGGYPSGGLVVHGVRC